MMKSKSKRYSREHTARTDRGEREGEKGPTRSQGAIEGLPVLRYGVNNNWTKFRKGMSIYCFREYGDLGEIIETGEMPELEEIERPDDEDLADDPYGLIKDAYRDKVKARDRRLEEMRKNLKPMYAAIYGQLSEESEDKIKQDANYAEVHQNKDTVGLWVIIGHAHQTGGTGVPAQDKLHARDSYSKLRQSRYETPLAFKERFDVALERLEAVGAKVPDEDLVAMDYISRLDDSRFGQLKADLFNDQQKGLTTFPDTLVDALQLASNYKITVKIHSDRQAGGAGATVFATTTKSGGGRASDKGNAGKTKETAKATEKYKKSAKEASGAREQQRDSRPQQKTPYVPKGGCWICQGPHMAQDCPRNTKALDDEYSDESNSDSGPKKGGKGGYPRKGTVKVHSPKSMSPMESYWPEREAERTK